MLVGLITYYIMSLPWRAVWWHHLTHPILFCHWLQWILSNTPAFFGPIKQENEEGKAVQIFKINKLLFVLYVLAHFIMKLCLQIISGNCSSVPTTYTCSILRHLYEQGKGYIFPSNPIQNLKFKVAILKTLQIYGYRYY